MSKKQAVYLAIGLGIMALYFLAKNKPQKIQVTNKPPQNNYISYNANFSNDRPLPAKSCGCSPAASKFLTATADKLNAEQDKAASKIAEYVQNVNAFTMTSIKS